MRVGVAAPVFFFSACDCGLCGGEVAGVLCRGPGYMSLWFTRLTRAAVHSEFIKLHASRLILCPPLPLPCFFNAFALQFASFDRFISPPIFSVKSLLFLLVWSSTQYRPQNSCSAQRTCFAAIIYLFTYDGWNFPQIVLQHLIFSPWKH